MSRAVRIAIGVVIGGVVAVGLVMALAALALRSHPRAAGQWVEFSIGPASGESATINRGLIRANGITLKMALGTAYEVPMVRVIGPSWISSTRYSMTAIVAKDATATFRPLLRRELENRFRLQTHIEPRPFDIFVLTATAAPRLEPSRHSEASTWIEYETARMSSASMDRLAGALEHILGTPVLDETGLTGLYDVRLDWSDDRVGSLTAMLRDRFGLRLAPARRDLDVLIIDSIHRDPALLLLGQAGRMTRRAPPWFRVHVAHALALR